MNDEYKNYEIYKYFLNSKLHSSKGNTFFPIYEELFSSYRGKDIVFVEIGVKMGGSLFMWRDYFGKKAKIIGIDFNPESLKLEKYGFKIFIGDQSSEAFWKSFFSKVGKIDILLDDGGHTNENQILTINNTIQNINDGGLLVTEDTLSSYGKKFFNPSKYSFINYSKFLIDDINGRIFDKTHQDTKYIGVTKKNSLNKTIYSIKFFNNFVAFFIDRKKCIEFKHLYNRDLEENPSEIIKDDFKNPRWNSEIYVDGNISKLIFFLSKKMNFLKKIEFLKVLVYKIKYFFLKRKINNFLKKYFD